MKTTATDVGLIGVDNDDDAAEITRLIKALNESAVAGAGSDTFIVCIRSGREWVRTVEGPTGAFQCAVLAASVSEAHGIVTAVFSVNDSGECEGPHLTFGTPPAILSAWVSDSGFDRLAAGAAASVTLNAARIAFIGAAVQPGSATEH